MRRFVTILATLALAASLTTPVETARAGETVLVFSAASTRDAMEEAIKAFPGADIRGVYAATPALARQILDGAPASIFLSASRAWTDELEKAALIAERRDFLRNRLVLIAPSTSPHAGGLKSVSDISAALGGGRLAIAETKAVPAGIYARQALTSLGIWNAVQDSLAPTANVRAALLLVERGETPLGIVYDSDARASSLVTTVLAIPETAHDPIIYPLALLASQVGSTDAAAFFAFLLSHEGRRVFSAHGFETE
jgi:molybdate transport system substrate-binding protein